MLNSKNEKRLNERLKTLHGRKKKYERLLSNPIKQKERDDSDNTQQERYKAIVENIPCAVYSAYPGKTGPTTFMSEKWKDWTGYSPEELYHDPEAWPKCIHPDDREKAVEAYSGACRDNVPYNLEYRIIHKETGQVRFVHDQGLLNKDEKDDFVRVDGIITDISERKQVERTLRVSEERFRTMLENLPNVAVQGYGPDGTIHYWNKANESIYGYTAEEALGKDLVELIIPPEMRSDVREVIAHGARTGEMPPAAELNLMRKDGSRVPVWSSHVVIRHAGKEPELFCIDVDLSELKRTEKALRESEERCKNLFNNALLGLYRTTPDGRILMANPALVRMLGYDSFEELASRNLEEEGFEPEYFRSNFKERIESEGRVIGLETGWTRHDGTILSIRESAKAIRDEYGNVLYYEGTVEDITERKRAEQELKKHRDHLEEIVAKRTRELEKNNEALQTEITERKQTEEALRMSELRFRSLIEQTTDAVFCYEYDPPIQTDLPVEQQVRLLYGGILVECNDVCAKSYGADRVKDVIGKRLTELFRTSPGSLDELFTKLIEGGYRTVDGEGIERLEDGTERYYLNNGHGVIEDGKLIRIWGTFRDITDHKKAQETLRQYEFMVESAHDAIFFKDRKSRYIIANKKTLESFGLPHEKVIGKNDYEIMPDKEQAKNNIDDDKAVFETGKPKEIIMEVTGVDGKKYWFQAIKVPHFDENGDVTGLIGIARDITDRKQAEEALKESEAKYVDLYENAPDMYASVNAKTTLIEECNTTLANTLGYSKKEIIGRPVFEIYHPDCLKEVKNAFQLFVETGEVHDKELQLRRKDGSKLDISLNVSSVRDKDGQILFSRSTLRDINKRKRVEDTLRKSEERLQLALDAAQLGQWDWNIVTGNVVWSQQCLALYGLPPDTPMSYDRFLQTLHPEDRERVDNTLRRAVEDRTSYNEVKRVVWPDGSIHWTASRGQVYCDAAGQPIRMIGVTFDITKWKEAEEENRSHLWFLENLDQVNRAIQANNDLEQMMSDVLDVVLSAFNCDRAFLLYPCDPQSQTWTVPMERIKPEYPGVLALGLEMPMDPQVAETFRVLLASDGPVKFGPETEFPLPKDVSEQFGFKSFMSIALHPRIGKSWQFGLHQCAYARIWTIEEERLFQEIGRRLEDALTSLLMYRNLKDSEERYRMVFENSPVSIWEEDFSAAKTVFDELRKEGIDDIENYFARHPETVRQCAEMTKIVDVNRAALTLHGAANKEELLAGLVNTFTLESLDIFRRELVCLWNRGTEMTADAVVKTLAGERRSVTVYFSVCPGHEQTLSKVLVSLIDITERKQAEEALRESEEKFRSLAEQSPNMIFINREGKIVYANKKCEEVMGYKRKELYSPDFDFRTLIAPESLSLIGDNFTRHLRGEEVQPYDYCLINKKGDRIEAINASKLIQYEGQTAILGIVTDITERKKAEQALRESEERLKILFESAPDAIYLADLEGIFVDGNRAAENLIGYTREDVIGKKVADVDLLSDEQLSRAQANLKKVIAGELSGPNEYTVKRKDGTYVSIEVRTFPVKIGGKMLSLGIARDITEHKLTEQKLLEHQAELKSLASQLSLTEERERHRLATDLHDQISQSLVISKIKLDQLRKSSGSGEFNKSLEDISKCLGQIIDDTRALTFDLSYPILYELGFEAAVAEWLADQIQEKHGIRTEFVDDGHNKPLDDDICVLLFRNVRELLINVVKHAHADKVRVSIRRIKDNISISVEDDGVGFDPVEAASLATQRAKYGLFSIRERLEQLGGRIKIDSKMGSGSRIIMKAPLKK